MHPPRSNSGVEPFDATQLARRQRQLTALQEIATTAGETELERLYPTLARIAAEATESDVAGIFLANEDGIVLAAAHGAAPEYDVSYYRLPANSESQRAIDQRVAIVGGSETYPPEKRVGAIPTHYAIMPMIVQDTVRGTINLARRTDRRYGDDEVGSIRVIADQIAIVVERARLYAESQQRVKQLTLLFELAQLGISSLDFDSLVARILDLMIETLAIDGVMIHLLHGDRLRLAGRRSRHPLPPGAISPLENMPLDDSSISGRAATELGTVIVNTFTGAPDRSRAALQAGAIRTAVATPLITNQKLVGTMLVVRSTETVFRIEEIRLVESCAAHIASALTHARLFEAERRRARELELLNELGRLVTEQLDLDSVLDAGVRQLSQLANAPQTFLLLFGPGRQALRMVASNVDEVSDIVVQIDEPSVVTRAIRERRPIIINDLDIADQSTFSAQRVARLNQRSLIAVPLVSRGDAIGAVLLADTDPARRFDETEVERAVAVSIQLATAIANAQLFEDLRASYRELERTQERLVQRERLAAIGEMAASIAHDVRNPLGVIFNSLASLKRLLPDTGDAQLLLAMAGEEAERLNRIVADLLDFARPSEPRLQAESVAAVIQGAVDAAITAEGVPADRIQVQLHEAIPRLSVDPQLLRQALINLLANALEASPPQLPIVVSATIERANERSFVRIDVADRGTGIPPSAAQQVFQPFYTTKAKGTGLGLSIVKRIVEAHQGRVSFDSMRGAGTTFSVRIPLDSTGL